MLIVQNQMPLHAIVRSWTLLAALPAAHELLVYGIRTYVEKNATICQICAPQSDKTMRHTFMVCLWICAGSAGYGIAALFAKRVAIRRTHRIFTAKSGTLRCGHQSAAHMVGEKWHTWRRVFKCRCGVFVAFFLTYTVCVCPHPSLHGTELVQDLVVVLTALANVCPVLYLDVQAFHSVVLHLSGPDVQLTLRKSHTFNQRGNIPWLRASTNFCLSFFHSHLPTSDLLTVTHFKVFIYT